VAKKKIVPEKRPESLGLQEAPQGNSNEETAKTEKKLKSTSGQSETG